jgi:hypothetical protein
MQRPNPSVFVSFFVAGLLVCVAGSADPARAAELLVAPPEAEVPGALADLESALEEATPNTTIRLFPGTYDLSPKRYVEPTCGNCEAESTRVEATVGLRVSGRGIRILGDSGGGSVVRTHAGYGILFEDCEDCALVAVTVTGGERDPSANATDAAVVAKSSSVSILDCVIRDNIGDSTVVAKTVVGIIGVAGREGSVLTIRGNRILRNSWDGIALYRDAQATIEANIIDGVDLARGEQVGGGRGVGIGVTWNARATIRGNLVRRYWKGIGGFVDAQITVEENIIEHMATWGLTLWDAGRGRPAGFFLRNVVYDTGACGASVIRGSNAPPFPGRFVQNVMVQTGQDPRYDSGEPYCFQEPIAEHAVPESFAIAGNILHRNRVPDDQPAPGDVDDRAFRYRVQTVWKRLIPWPPIRESDFLRDFALGS